MIAGLYGKSMFSFVRNHQIIFQSDSTILLSHQQYVRVPVAPHPLPAFHVVSVLDFGYSDRCVVVSRLNLHFPEDI